MYEHYIQISLSWFGNVLIELTVNYNISFDLLIIFRCFSDTISQDALAQASPS